VVGIISLLCHDIGCVRGICQADGNGRCVSNLVGDKITLAEGATDASLTPYHVARSKLFARERYLRITQEGQQWVANLYANVFSMEQHHRGRRIPARLAALQQARELLAPVYGWFTEGFDT
jgi:hypothetical protein